MQSIIALQFAAIFVVVRVCQWHWFRMTNRHFPPKKKVPTKIIKMWRPTQTANSFCSQSKSRTRQSPKPKHRTYLWWWSKCLKIEFPCWPRDRQCDRRPGDFLDGKTSSSSSTSSPMNFTNPPKKRFKLKHWNSQQIRCFHFLARILTSSLSLSWQTTFDKANFFGGQFHQFLASPCFTLMPGCGNLRGTPPIFKTNTHVEYVHGRQTVWYITCCHIVILVCIRCRMWNILQIDLCV